MRYITHLQLLELDEQVPDLSQATYEAAEDPVGALSSAPAAPAAPAAPPRPHRAATAAA